MGQRWIWEWTWFIELGISGPILGSIASVSVEVVIFAGLVYFLMFLFLPWGCWTLLKSWRSALSKLAGCHLVMLCWQLTVIVSDSFSYFPRKTCSVWTSLYSCFSSRYRCSYPSLIQTARKSQTVLTNWWERACTTSNQFVQDLAWLQNANIT